MAKSFHIPTRKVAQRATAYQTVLVLKTDTVSPGAKPYSLTRIVLRAVACCLTCAKSRRSWVAALLYQPSSSLEEVVVVAKGTY